MNFAFSEEQEEFRRQVRKWLEQNAPSPVVRQLMETDSGFDREVWKETADLGWQAMAIPEEQGGAGFGYLELTILFEEMGRSLFPAPFLSTLGLAMPLISDLGSEEQKQEMLSAIALGEKTVAVAFTEPSGNWDPGMVETSAVADGDGWAIEGRKSFVVDGASADDLLVSANTDKEIGIFVVAGDNDAVEKRGLETLDQTRKLAEVTFSGARASRLGESENGLAALRRMVDKAIVLLAAEQVGGAQKCLEMSVDYAKTRHQFGRPIGSFQAIKHKCADMLVQVESAKSAAYYAGWAASEDNEELATVAPLAKSYCSEAYFYCASENIQIHGGIGFTWEHDAHLYFKRAKSSQLLFGDPAYHRARLGDLLGI
ncbi:MAG TPA: acyl-CoA dehydrogenase family protein [Acidimicrobiia bacterium]|nr:acyl-CoA dehydrogenase family protein [Acidimicrobiia bacterium]